MNIQTDRAFIPAHATTTTYLTVTVTAPARERSSERPAAQVALVLDRSGSMAGRKIEMAKKAVAHALQLLNARDRVALVCYDTEIDTLLGATPATPEAKTLAQSRLNAIDARGGTDLAGGWMRGAEEVGVCPRSASAGTDPAPSLPENATGTTGSVSRVLLLSDGLANQGESNPAALARYAAELRGKGITTSTFGLGADFDEVLMSRLATEGGGHFYYIEQPAQIPDFFTSELGEALEVVARDARLIIASAPGTEVECLNAFPVARAHQGREMHVRLGDLVSEQQVTVVLSVRCVAGDAGSEVAITARLADRDAALFPQPMPIEWRVVDAATDAAQPVNAAVLVDAAQLLAEGARAEALSANRRGDFDRATQILQAGAAMIRAIGRGDRQVEAIAARLEAEQEEYRVGMDAMELKQRHFSSYGVAFSRTTEGKARRRSAS